MAIAWTGVAVYTAISLLLGLALAYALAVRHDAAARAAGIALVPLLAVPAVIVAAMRLPGALPEAAILTGLPFTVFLAGRRFRDIDRAYGNAARSQGAPEWRIVCRFLLPLAWPEVAAGAGLAFARIAIESAIAARL